jgi:hypothetical protein
MKQPKVGGECPWGRIQGIVDVGGDCVFVDTPSHGGVYVPAERLKEIPQEMREYAASWSGSEHWYEEDECAAIPLHYLDLIGNNQVAHHTVSQIRERLNKAA